MRLPVSICRPCTSARPTTRSPRPTQTQSLPTCRLQVCGSIGGTCRSFTSARNRSSRLASAPMAWTEQATRTAAYAVSRSGRMKPPARWLGPFLHLERDALGQRQFAAPVDGVGLPAHVGLPGIRARLTAATRILLAAERAADLGA